MGFLDDKYLLRSETSFALYGVIKDLPIVDPHNHANVKEIADNLNYDNPWQLFAATDHYVWEVLRKRGVNEKYITGNASPKEKWTRMASVFPEIAGNPVYEWIHLDLKRYLNIDTLLDLDSAEDIWEEAKAVLSLNSKRPQQLLQEIGVEVMCSTDDPVDLLEDHARVNKEFGRIMIRPTWRPDKAMKIFSDGWREYMKEIGTRFNTNMECIDDLIQAMRDSHDFFADNNCVASDHGIEVPFAGNVDRKDADAVFRKAMSGKELTAKEENVFMSYFLGEVAEMDSEKNWVFQLHLGAVRDIRTSIFHNIGPDSGGDVSDHYLDILGPLKSFLNRFDERLKVVLYCLDPSHIATLATISRAYGAKVNLGAPWWLNDNPIGMRRQLEYIGSVDLLANFAGMVSDSRKLLSYGSRFEMFRRILADVLGTMIDDGQMSYPIAENLAKKIAYSSPKQFFKL